MMQRRTAAGSRDSCEDDVPGLVLVPLVERIVRDAKAIMRGRFAGLCRDA
jgi:hypothetical protein